MLTNYLKIAYRTLLKHKSVSAIQLLGLIMGMLAVLLILQYVRYEYSYDRQSPHAAQIWRVFNETLSNGQVVTQDANSHSKAGPALKAEMPEVVDFTRLVNYGLDEATLIVEGKEPFLESRFFAVDQGFFRLFPHRFILGNPETCLSGPWQMVLTESAARRIFGGSDPIGQTLRIPGDQWAGEYTITGVVADPPVNTHLKFNVLVSLLTREARGHTDNWTGYWDYTYLQLSPTADAAKVSRRLAELSEEHLKKEGIRLDIQPFTDIHLHSNLTYELEPNGDAQTVGLLVIAALLILGIALMNSVNLSAARSLERAKEIGLRKTLGANRRQLFKQFLLETFLLNGLALLLALATLPFLIGGFSKLTGKPLDHFTATSDPVFLGAVMLMFVSSILLASVLPALSLSRFRPIDVLRGVPVITKLQSGTWQTVHKGLVVFQFVCSTVLLIALVVIGRQVHFLRNHDLGLELDQIIAVKSPGIAWQDTVAARQVKEFERQVGQLPGVINTCRSSVVPSLGINNISGSSTGLSVVGLPSSGKMATVYFVETDPRFFEVYGIRFFAGSQYCHPDRREAHRHVVINKAAADVLGFLKPEDAPGNEFFFNQSPENRYMVHGVIDNFHIETLKEPARPTIYRCSDDGELAYLSIKAQPENLTKTLPAIHALWRKNFRDAGFRYFFLDQQFAAQYRAEQQFGFVFAMFAGLAMLIACLGLFALTTHAVERRTKEIGIRKLLGASVASIVGLLSKDFLSLVTVSLVIASPIAWYFMNQWLADFAYRVEIDWWVFALAGFLAVAVAFLTVGFQSVKAALANPVKSLRSE